MNSTNKICTHISNLTFIEKETRFYHAWQHISFFCQLYSLWLSKLYFFKKTKCKICSCSTIQQDNKQVRIVRARIAGFRRLYHLMMRHYTRGIMNTERLLPVRRTIWLLEWISILSLCALEVISCIWSSLLLYSLRQWQ